MWRAEDVTMEVKEPVLGHDEIWKSSILFVIQCRTTLERVSQADELGFFRRRREPFLVSLGLTLQRAASNKENRQFKMPERCKKEDLEKVRQDTRVEMKLRTQLNSDNFSSINRRASHPSTNTSAHWVLKFKRSSKMNFAKPTSFVVTQSSRCAIGPCRTRESSWVEWIPFFFWNTCDSGSSTFQRHRRPSNVTWYCDKASGERKAFTWSWIWRDHAWRKS